MNPLLVFNHHSLPFDSKEHAEDSIPEFLRICVKSRNLGLNTILVDESIDSSWFNHKLSEGYYWRDWYNQHNNDTYKDLVRAFRSIQTMQPFFSREDIDKNVELFEVELKEEKGYSALRAASWNESPLVSFPSAVLWKKSPLLILVRTLDQDEKINEMKIEIINLYSLEVYEKYQPVFLQERNTLLKRSLDLYSQWKTLFPYLTYCGKVQEQLLGWSASNTVLGQVLESLTVLNTFCEQWNDGSIHEYTHERLRVSGLNHKISGESESVRKNETLKKERIFWLPDGRKAFFENHIKLTQGYRIHFYPDPSLRTIYISYIGKHLRL